MLDVLMVFIAPLIAMAVAVSGLFVEGPKNPPPEPPADG